MVSVQVLTNSVRQMSDLAPLLPVLMPELLRRMGHLPVVEPAEEVRLGLAGLVACLVERCDKRLLAAYTGDVCVLLCRWAGWWCGPVARAGDVGWWCGLVVWKWSGEQECAGELEGRGCSTRLADTCPCPCARLWVRMCVSMGEGREGCSATCWVLVGTLLAF